MSGDTLLSSIARQIAAATGKPFTLQQADPVGGGCINTAYKLAGETGAYFVKLNRKPLLPMFEAELAGLADMAATQTVAVPRPIACGEAGDQAFLAMQYLPLRPAGTAALRQLGWQLAAMHSITQAYFGWQRDNTIGSTPQPNPRSSDWVAFYTHHRLGHQLQLAARQGYRGRLQRDGERLMASLPAFFAAYQPTPSLLHGDLWGGNAAADAEGKPVIFDPACYYGDREADIAMTELFGGFGGDFKAAYHEALPLDAGYAVRKTLYNLYHIINHLNLFGGGYLSQAEGMMGRLLAELR